MIYSNLLYFLAAILALSAAPTSDRPWLSPLSALALLGLMLLGFHVAAAKTYKAAFRIGSIEAYFSAEKKLSLLAVLFFAAALFFLDLKHYLKPLSLGGVLPVLEQLAGLMLFFLLLSLMWLQARPLHEMLFGRSHSPASFVLSGLRSRMTLILPWLLLSLCFDLASQLSGFQRLLNSPWSSLMLLPPAVVLLALLLPPAVRRLWNCVPLEPGPLRSEIEDFLRSQNFSAKIFIWPLFEGRMPTAAIMGLLSSLRCLLLTPALLELLSKDELQSVLVHEIAHAKRRHLELCMLLFFGFSILAEALSEPLIFLLLNSEWLYRLLVWRQMSADKLLTELLSAAMIVLTLLYFRFLFGYFVRNFERQADLYVFEALGTCFPLIRAFERIASLSSNARNRKNWHHFGIGERIDFLLLCERDPKNIRRHERKVKVGLVLYFVLIALAAWSLHQIDVEALSRSARSCQIRVLLEDKLKHEPNNGALLKFMGDLLLEDGKEEDSLKAYEKSLNVRPMQAEAARSLAWLLLTAKDTRLRDPVRALQLAQLAAQIAVDGPVLDTLAVALWSNGRTEEAIRMEAEAARKDPENRRSYQARAERFGASPSPSGLTQNE